MYYYRAPDTQYLGLSFSRIQPESGYWTALRSQFEYCSVVEIIGKIVRIWVEIASTSKISVT